MKTENELAGLMAARLYELMREEAKARGVVSVFLPFHKWEDASELQHEALTNVVARIMREAREQKEEWTRAFIEAEVQRMREHIRQPGRFLQVEELTERFRGSVFASGPVGVASTSAEHAHKCPQCSRVYECEGPLCSGVFKTKCQACWNIPARV
jgi:hypothetical protein